MRAQCPFIQCVSSRQPVSESQKEDGLKSCVTVAVLTFFSPLLFVLVNLARHWCAFGRRSLESILEHECTRSELAAYKIQIK